MLRHILFSSKLKGLQEKKENKKKAVLCLYC